MGKHIVPRHLLRRISLDKKGIWQYDKKTRTISSTPLSIDKVSQTRNFFDEDVEKLLSTIEKAANPVLDKLTQEKPINSMDKRVMAVYLEMYNARNRENRKEQEGKFSGSRSQVKKFMDAAMKHMHGTRFHTKYTNQKEEIIFHLKRSSLSHTWAPFDLVRYLFFHMTWYVLKSEKTDFVVGEPPVAFADTGIRLGHPEAEVFFPLSSKHVLYMNWFGDPAMIEKMSIPPAVAHRINEIFVSASTRFVFFNKNCPQITEMVRNRIPGRKEMKFKYLATGTNPHRPKRPWNFTEEELERYSKNICMHPDSPNFNHVWFEPKDHLMLDEGKATIELCVHCKATKYKYDDRPFWIRNNEVNLAVGNFAPYRNWWMKL